MRFSARIIAFAQVCDRRSGALASGLQQVGGGSDFDLQRQSLQGPFMKDVRNDGV